MELGWPELKTLEIQLRNREVHPLCSVTPDRLKIVIWNCWGYPWKKGYGIEPVEWGQDKHESCRIQGIPKFYNIPTDILLYFGNRFVVQMLKLCWKDK